MQRILKITLIVIISVILLSIFYKVYAAQEIDQLEGRSTMGFDPKVEEINETDTNLLFVRVGKILGFIQIIGIILSVMALMIIGIKEMLASAEEKSNLKQSIPLYIIGVAMIASITTLPKIIYDVVQAVK